MSADPPDTSRTERSNGVDSADVRRQALIGYLDYLDTQYGPPSDEVQAEANRRWDEMWDQRDERAASPSTRPQ